MKSGYGGGPGAEGFGIGPSGPFGGAFNNVPERVGSAPATDISAVS